MNAKASTTSKVSTSKVNMVNPNLCPICKQNNQCGNASPCDQKSDCWCRSPNIKFSRDLLNQIPDEAKGKSCLCKNCALGQSELNLID